jgi:hypothetical protein
MNDHSNLDPTALRELIARRWQEDPGYYTLNRNADGGWLEGFWVRRADHSGVELHWTRPPQPASGRRADRSRVGRDHFVV